MENQEQLDESDEEHRYSDFYRDYMFDSDVIEDREDVDEHDNDNNTIDIYQSCVLSDEEVVEIHDEADNEPIQFYQSPNIIRHEEQHETFVSPGGTKYWIPKVNEKVRIDVGSSFPNVEAADVAYRKYAEEAGFDVRQSTKRRNKDGDVQNRYLLCSKQGFPDKKEYQNIQDVSGNRKSRNSNYKRSGCKACIKFRYSKADKLYVVYKFEERHNHSLFNYHEKKLSRANRKLQYMDYRNVYNSASSSIGGAKSHMIQAGLKGGYEYVGATAVDYENARRDMSSFVGSKDAQMLVNLLSKRRRAVPEFFYDILVLEGELQAIFWVDEIGRLNYKEFGDTISFDATYRTNRHAMNFVPFIAIDNHKRSVVVGAALVSHENIDNFKWVLCAFLKAHGKQPTFVITDQCAAMKQAIPAVFTESIHRLCMWHIMKKLPGKITADLDQNTTFKRRFNKLVWSTHMKPEEFELEWSNIIDEYDLHRNDWLSDMYQIRHSWIPAYYKDVPMSGLMRTTSRSESSHAFFRIYAHYRNDLVKFLHAFDGAIERQRNKHRTLEFVTKNTFPRVATPLLIERHAVEVYTRTVFFQVRKEIKKAVLYCGIVLVGEDGDVYTYRVLHKNTKSVTKRCYKVVHDSSSNMMQCECNFLVRNGFMCRHMFKVLLNDDCVAIPDCYISRRWTRSLVPVEVQAARARYGEYDVEKERLINRLYSKMDMLVSRIRNETGKLNRLGDILDNATDEFDVVDTLTCPADDRADALRDCYGVDVPDKVEILPPAGIRNKGCGTGKRLIGTLEKAKTKIKRNKRMCKNCHTLSNHDSRNCPLRNNRV